MKRAALAGLAELKRQLEDRERTAAATRAALAAAAARDEALRHQFSASVGPITLLPASDRVQQTAAGVEPLPRQRERDEAAALQSSLSDEMNVQTLLDTDAALGYLRAGVDPDVLRRLRRGQWAIQAELDLHGARRDEARERVADFIRRCANSGLRCVRIVHGKGHGSPGREPVLKDKVKVWLAQKSQVVAFAQARAADGGHGALVVLLHSQSSRA